MLMNKMIKYDLIGQINAICVLVRDIWNYFIFAIYYLFILFGRLQYFRLRWESGVDIWVTCYFVILIFSVLVERLMYCDLLCFDWNGFCVNVKLMPQYFS